MIRAVAHAGVCVPDLDEAIEWYTSVLGLEVLMPPVVMRGEEIERDMGDLVPGVALRGAILGFEGAGDHVIELLEYPDHPGRAVERRLTDPGFSHLGLVCDDIEATRAHLERRGVRFLSRGIAAIVGLQTTWLEDPYGLVYILMEKRDAAKPYYRQA